MPAPKPTKVRLSEQSKEWPVILADGSIPFTGNQSMGGNNLIELADPLNAQDAATKSYVDSHGGYPKQLGYAGWI